MRLIAKRPCSFGGRQFYIGDEIQEDLVTDAQRQEKLGTISIVDENAEASGGEPGAFFTQEQADTMVKEAVNNAVAEAEQEYLQKQEALKQRIAELEEGVPYISAEPVEFNPETYDGKIIIPVDGESDGENGRKTAVPATPEEIRQVFNILQMNAEEGARAIAEVKEENVLILLHAGDSRKAIKTAARKQADALFAEENSNGSDEDAGNPEDPRDNNEDAGDPEEADS